MKPSARPRPESVPDASPVPGAPGATAPVLRSSAAAETLANAFARLRDEREREERTPIVDWDSGFAWLPVQSCPTASAALAAAAKAWPQAGGHSLLGRERLRTRALDPDDPDDAALAFEFGCTRIADFCGPGEGREYWMVAFDEDPRPRADTPAERETGPPAS